MKKIIILGILSHLFILSCAEEVSQDQKNPSDSAKKTNILEPDILDQEEPRDDFVDTKDFVQEFKQVFPGYTTLKPQILAELVSIIPAQKTSWGCGLHQSEAAIETAFINKKLRRKNKTDFDKVCTYPLAIDININNPTIKNVLSFLPSHELKKLKDASDAEGFFRVGALPHDLARYINTNLPKNYTSKAHAISTDRFLGSELLEVVKHNLTLQLPTPVIYMIDPDKYLMHVYLIVGFKNESLVILDTTKEGVERFLTKDADDFVKGMNAESIIHLVKQASNLRPLLAALNRKLADEKTLELWKAYSVLRFNAE